MLRNMRQRMSMLRQRPSGTVSSSSCGGIIAFEWLLYGSGKPAFMPAHKLSVN